MIEDSNKIFLGCNYNDKAIKTQFDRLKSKIETDTPFQCVIIDKRGSKPAKDLWVDIQEEISLSAACFFDVTGFRPNVVLELGFALAMKNNDQLFITFRTRKNISTRKSSTPNWILSDIAHLNREQYKNLTSLERYVRSQIEKLNYAKNFMQFQKDCDKTKVPDRYKEMGLVVLKTLRDEGDKTELQIKNILTGTGCHLNKITSLMKGNKLIKKKQGPNGRWTINSGW